MALEGQGKRREAMDSFRRALAIDPNFELAKARLAQLEETQQMSKVLGRKKSLKAPPPLVLTAAPGTPSVATDEAVQLTPWTPPPPDTSLREPVAAPAGPAKSVSLRPAFDDRPQVLTSPSIVIQPTKTVAAVPPPRQPAPKPAEVTVHKPKPVQATAPEAPSKPRIVSAGPAAPPRAPVTVTKPVATGEGGTDVVYAIQLGSFETQELAESAWKKALKVAGDLLNGLSHAVEATTSSDKVKYRLLAEALPDRQAAFSLCRTLRDKGATCIVVRR
jgi:cell division protein FtsN